jgi:hypothetical protein
MKFCTWAALALGILVLAAPLSAHHGTATYDSKSTTVSGVVTDFEFINPHVLLKWESKDAKGDTQEWMAEIGAPNNLERTGGWTRDIIHVGDHIAVTGRRAKNGSTTMISSPGQIVVNGKKLVAPGGEGEAAGRGA